MINNKKNMRQLFNSILICLAFAAGTVFTAKAQCTDTLPANTIIITADTTIGTGGFNNNYLICPGVKVIYSGTQSIMNHYYLETGAKLTLNSYHYPYIYLKTTAEINAQHSINPASLIMSLYAEPGAIFTDTLNPFTPNINWCNPLVYNYINLPNAQGCPFNSVNTNDHKTEISIYPNPFTVKTTIESKKYDLVSIQITDVSGNIVYSRQSKGKSITIDRNGFEKGIYFVQITDEKKNVLNKKILIQ
jgi:hypothetical protein